ncbi:MAG: CoA ester lyase [candidate division NC10 bacterium]|nr:CoA ester lyase [candidate division NC10 bacterium]
MRVRRGLLFIPGSDERKLAKSRALTPDAFIFDLEDGVAPDRKAEARRNVAALLREERPGLAERTVRVNGLHTPFFAEDLRAIVGARPDALVLPKVEAPEEVAAIEAAVAAAERAAGVPGPGPPLLLFIESARGLAAAAAIAGASCRVEALILGHADLCKDLGVRQARATEGILLHVRCTLVLAARAAGVEAVDTIYETLGDVEGLRTEAEQAAALGFAGKLALHPAQVEPIQAAFTPSPEEVTYARRVVEGFEAARAAGRGVFTLDGRMVDEPFVEVERRLLARARQAGLA